MELRHPHITGTKRAADQDYTYLVVYTDVEVQISSRPDYDEKLAAELRELVKKKIGRDPPYEGRFIFRRGVP
jgi:hypothetical protein